MRTPRMATALAVVLVLAFAVGTASAGRLEFSNRDFRLTFPILVLTAGGVTSECPVTLEGTLHSATIRKVLGALIGHITRARSNNAACGGSSGRDSSCGTEVINATVTPNTLPWHVRYQGFGGTLPNITRVSIDIVGASILGAGGGASCLYRSTTARPWRGIFEVSNPERFLTGFRSDETGRDTSPWGPRLPCGGVVRRQRRRHETRHVDGDESGANIINPQTASRSGGRRPVHASLRRAQLLRPPLHALVRALGRGGRRRARRPPRPPRRADPRRRPGQRVLQKAASTSVWTGSARKAAATAERATAPSRPQQPRQRRRRAAPGTPAARRRPARPRR